MTSIDIDSRIMRARHEAAKRKAQDRADARQFAIIVLCAMLGVLLGGAFMTFAMCPIPIRHTPPLVTEHRQHLPRSENELEVTVTCSWRYNAGEFVERGHRFNGHGKGWECDEVTATDADNKPVHLTAREQETAIEKGRAELDNQLFP